MAAAIPEPQRLGVAFAKKYYRTLAETPRQAELFYQEDAMLTRTVDGAQTEHIGLAAISEFLQSGAFTDLRTLVVRTTAQKQGDFLCVQVTGFQSRGTEKPWRFAEMFLLSKGSRRSYFVLNDIFTTMNEDIGEILSRQPSVVVCTPPKELESSAPSASIHADIAVSSVPASVGLPAETAEPEPSSRPNVPEPAESTTSEPVPTTIPSEAVATTEPEAAATESTHPEVSVEASVPVAEPAPTAESAPEASPPVEPVPEPISASVPSTATSPVPASAAAPPPAPASAVVPPPAPTSAPAPTPAPVPAPPARSWANVAGSRQSGGAIGKHTIAPTRSPIPAPGAAAVAAPVRSTSPVPSPSPVASPSPQAGAAPMPRQPRRPQAPMLPSIFVRGLTPAMTEQKLAELFSSCGKVVRVEFAPGATYGWVTFEKQEQQEAAVAKDNWTLDGVPLHVEPRHQNRRLRPFRRPGTPFPGAGPVPGSGAPAPASTVPAPFRSGTMAPPRRERPRFSQALRAAPAAPATAPRS